MEDDLITESLMAAAEQEGDLLNPIYANYFARCPGSQELMDHTDEHVRGRMLDEVFRLLMVPDYDQETGYLNFEVQNHTQAYRVRPEMYDNLLQAVWEEVRKASGIRWQAAMDTAWSERTGALIEEIRSRLNR